MIELVHTLRTQLKQAIRGQNENCDLMLVALLSGGHVLLEGLPGLGKTFMVRALGQLLAVDFKRIQCTPDLMPADVIGTTIITGIEGKTSFREGPVFTTFLMADELNRANPRTQAALLEAMQERQVTVDGTTKKLSDLFFCVATQNPIELEGTYPLPEAQLDRFLFKLRVGYPEAKDELNLLSWYAQHKNMADYPIETVGSIAKPDDIKQLRDHISNIKVETSLIQYIYDLVQASRNNRDIESGASPRAAIALLCASRALAFMEGRDFVIPDDIKTLLLPVLGHRIRLMPEAELNGVSVVDVVRHIGESVKVPL